MNNISKTVYPTIKTPRSFRRQHQRQQKKKSRCADDVLLLLRVPSTRRTDRVAAVGGRLFAPIGPELIFSFMNANIAMSVPGL
jgi:hypothetical protein